MKLDELLKKATRPPWKASGIWVINDYGTICVTCKPDVWMKGSQMANAKLLAHAAMVLPDLVSACKELVLAEREIERVRRDYLAGTCNAEDAHRDAARRYSKAVLDFASSLARAETVTSPTSKRRR